MNDLGRKVALLVGATALIGMGTLTACSTSTKETPTTTSNSPSPTASNTVSGTPNEKGLDPKSPNSFSPSVKAPPAPTAEPG